MTEVTYSEAQFRKTAEIITSLPKDGPVKPSQEDKLYFYARYKQGTIGDVDIIKPVGLFDFAGKAKWEAWNALKGTSKEEARTCYVAKFIAILEATEGEQSKKYIEEIQAA